MLAQRPQVVPLSFARVRDDTVFELICRQDLNGNYVNPHRSGSVVLNREKMVTTISWRANLIGWDCVMMAQCKVLLQFLLFLRKEERMAMSWPMYLTAGLIVPQMDPLAWVHGEMMNPNRGLADCGVR
jgi:hypothetical protein